MATEPAVLSLSVDPQALASLVRLVVRQVLAEVEEARHAIPENGQLAFSEEEAAGLLGLEPHVLRDERRRGRITASTIVGRRVRYQKADLVRYLAERRIENGKQ